jgi:hypothetical protein
MSNQYTSVEPLKFYSFQIGWENTLKCNLDCSYCSSEFHNNSIPHPSLEECKETIDFIMSYTDLYMRHRVEDQRDVGLNIHGGESLFHPDLEQILDYCLEKYQPYKNHWNLSIQTITNAVVKEKIWKRIIDKIDYWTVSYHPESTIEQQDLVRKNILALRDKNKNFHVAILMHTKHWDNCISMIEWCEENNIKFLPRQIDHAWTSIQYYYTKEQAAWLRNYHKTGSTKLLNQEDNTQKPTLKEKVNYIKESITNAINMNSEGRQCCGGNRLCINQDYSQSQTHVLNQFNGWACAVNYSFLYIRQVSKEIFLNKDCKMNFEGEIGPIGYLNNHQEILKNLENDLKNKTLKTIICKKKKCFCGICSPKAITEEKLNIILKRLVI